MRCFPHIRLISDDHVCFPPCEVLQKHVQFDDIFVEIGVFFFFFFILFYLFIIFIL